jgi:single-strand DNA-binding protein
MYLNKAMIYGNLTRDPEKRALPSGQSVASFAVATNRTYTDKDGKKQEQTEYHDVVVFGKLADVMGQWLKKGRPVYIEGRLQTRSWDQDGVKRYRTEIVADTFQFGDGGTRDGGGMGGSQTGDAPQGQNAPASQQGAPEYPEEEINPEDIPF